MAQYSGMPGIQTGFASREINGQLVPVFMGSGFLNVGNAVGPTYLGYGSNTPATIPLTQGAVAGGPAPALGGSAFQITPRSAIVLGVMLIIGVAGLRYIHWRA